MKTFRSPHENFFFHSSQNLRWKVFHNENFCKFSGIFLRFSTDKLICFSIWLLLTDLQLS